MNGPRNRSRSRYSGREPRREQGVILVSGDGESEKVYFDRLSDLCESVGIKTYAVSKAGMDVILRKTEKYAKQHGLDPSKGDLVAIVMDLDGKFTEEEVEEMGRNCLKRGYELYISNPAFEIWLLCHYRTPSHPCTPAELVDDMNEVLGRPYTKAKSIEIDDGMVGRAIENAERLLSEDECNPIECYKRNPSTMVHSLVRKIRERISKR